MGNGYFELLKDPRWQKKRLEILQRDDFTCVNCCNKTKQLQVHHCYYVKNRKPWEYPGFSLMTLCSDCHSDKNLIREDEPNISSWESIIDVIFNGNKTCVDDNGSHEPFWDIGVIMCQLRSKGFSEVQIIEALILGLMKLWKDKEPPQIYLKSPWVPDQIKKRFEAKRK